MNALVKDIPLAGRPQRSYSMWIGEPRHGVPEIAREALARIVRGLRQVSPRPRGRRASGASWPTWLNRRYGLPDDLIDPDRSIIPVQGTREGLFMIALAAVPSSRARLTPLALMPNPFYPPYKAVPWRPVRSRFSCPAPPKTVSCRISTGLPPTSSTGTGILYLCSPANPQGVVADLAYLRRAVDLARQHDFLLISDECYTEIWDREPPAGVMQICAADATSRMSSASIRSRTFQHSRAAPRLCRRRSRIPRRLPAPEEVCSGGGFHGGLRHRRGAVGG